MDLIIWVSSGIVFPVMGVELDLQMLTPAIVSPNLIEAFFSSLEMHQMLWKNLQICFEYYFGQNT